MSSKKPDNERQVDVLVRRLVEQIMQEGFEVAMTGNYDKSEEWNTLNQSKEYDKAVEKYTEKIKRLA